MAEHRYQPLASRGNSAWHRLETVVGWKQDQVQEAVRIVVAPYMPGVSENRRTNVFVRGSSQSRICARSFLIAAFAGLSHATK